MDPVTAIGVASAAVQFLQFSLQVLGTCREIRDSAQSSTEQHRELEEALQVIRARREELADSQKSRAPRRISDIARECVQLSEELTEVLKHVRGAGQNIGKARAIFRSLKDQRKIEKLENRLRNKQVLLDQVLLQDTWVQSQLLVIEQGKGFNKLDTKLQELVRDLLKKNQDISDSLTQLDLNQQTRLGSLGRDISTKLETAEHSAQARSNEAERSSKARHDESQLAQQRDRFLNTLFFEDIYARRQNIRDAAPRTVGWVFDPPSGMYEHNWDSFVDWLQDTSSSTYWIRGKAGSGKSTLMAHIVDDKRTKKNLKICCGSLDLHILSFYFWLPGSQLQRSSVGLLRSLLFQICQAKPSLIEVILTDMSTTVDRLGTWTEKTLADAITGALRAADDAFFAIFIDALDEYSGDYSAVLDLAFNISDIAGVKCCLSSRPEAQIVKRLGTCKHLLLERLNLADIKSFVESRLAKVDLSPDVKETMRKRIVYHADGVFMWAVLVVQDLIVAVDSGDDDPEVLIERIDCLPQELEELFATMVKKIHPTNRSNLALFISTVRQPFWSSQSLLLPISLITAMRKLEALKSQPFSDLSFTKLCAQTETQVATQSAGLLVVNEAHGRIGRMEQADYCFVKRLTADSTPSRSDASPDAANANTGSFYRTKLANPPAFSFTMYEDRRVDWIHRSAHDFIFGDQNSGLLKSWMPSRENLMSRIYDAALWLISEAPAYSGQRLYGYASTTSRIQVLTHIIAESYLSSPSLTESAMTRARDIVEKLDPSEFEDRFMAINRYEAAALKHVPIMQLATAVFGSFGLKLHHLKSPSGVVKACCALMNYRQLQLDLMNNLLLWLYHNRRSGDLSEFKDVCIDSINRLIVEYEERCMDGAGCEDRILITFSIIDRDKLIDDTDGWNTWLSTFTFRYHAPLASQDMDTLWCSEIVSSAFFLIWYSAVWEDGNRLAKQFFDVTGMYRGVGFESSRVSIQFPATNSLSSGNWALVKDLRILCMPMGKRTSVRTKLSFTRTLNPFDFGSRSYYEMIPDTISLYLSQRVQTTCVEAIAGLLDGGEMADRSFGKVIRCRDMLIEDIWANDHGLSSTEQLLAIGCVKKGFVAAFHEKGVNRFAKCLSRMRRMRQELAARLL